MYLAGDSYRLHDEQESDLGVEDYRTPWRRDFARLLFSPAFRRLQGKTQLFPTQESDYFRNRLTHSLEVAHIAKSIAIRLNNTVLANTDFQIEEDICEFAGLAHDLGHPPFGHQGEEALNDCMKNSGGFEGNAQTLRILTKLEKKVIPSGMYQADFISYKGLNLTVRTIASILKYDRSIPIKNDDRPEDWKNKAMKGYYLSEVNEVEEIKNNIVGPKWQDIKFKTIECQIMDIADDIAYSTYDLEDSMKAGFVEPLDIIFSKKEVIKETRKKVNDTLKLNLSAKDIEDNLFEFFNNIFDVKPEDAKDIEKIDAYSYAIIASSTAYQTSKRVASNGFFRTEFTSRQVGEAIRNIEFELNEDLPLLSKVMLKNDYAVKHEILKHFVYESQIDSPKIRIAEYRGKEIVKEIFELLHNGNGFKLLPFDYQFLYDSAGTVDEKSRVISDFISGMTDRYCSEFYYRIKSENPKSIFKQF